MPSVLLPAVVQAPDPVLKLPSGRYTRPLFIHRRRPSSCGVAGSVAYHAATTFLAGRLVQHYSPFNVHSDSPSQRVTGPDLMLDGALQLIQQSGRELPEIEDPAWLQEVINALCDLSSRDALTGLANRRQMELALAREIDRVARAGEPALLLLADIDHFKRVNDTQGHAAGDEVLRVVAKSLLACVRPMDTLARFGGEEFAMILPNCSPNFGKTVTERVRHTVEQQTIALPMGPPVSVTISLGGAFAPQWVRSSPALWIERADRQLYRAKTEGRNRACLEQAQVSHVSAEEKSLLFGTSNFQDIE